MVAVLETETVYDAAYILIQLVVWPEVGKETLYVGSYGACDIGWIAVPYTEPETV